LLRRLMWRWRRKARGGTRPQLDSAEAIKRKFRLQPPGTYLTRPDLERLALLGSEQLPNGRGAFRLDTKTRAWRKFESRTRKPQIKKLRVPVLILRGVESTLVGAGQARRMHRKIPHSTFREISRAFHHVPLDNPAGTAEAIVEFVESAL